MYSKKRAKISIFFLFSFLILSASIGFCYDSDKPGKINSFDISPEIDTKQSRSIKLTFWQFSVQEELINSLITRFEKSHPNIKIEVQSLSWEYGLDKIFISLAAGNPPDICELGNTWVPKFASSNMILDITQNASPLKDKYIMWESATFENKIYGMPWLGGTRVIFYNKDLFRKAGLNTNKPPSDWNELLEYAKKIDALENSIHGFSIFTGDPYSLWIEFVPFMWSNNGNILSEDLKNSVLSSPQNIETLYFFKELKKYSLVDKLEQINDLFAKGKIGMQISGLWNLKIISDINPSLNFEIAKIPPKNKLEKTASFGGGEILVIMKNTKYPKECFEFINFLSSEEVMMEISKKQENLLPVSINSINDPYFQYNPRQKIFMEQFLSSKPAPAHPEWTQIEESLTKAIEEVVIKDENPETSLKTAHLTIQKTLTLNNDQTSTSLNIIFILFIEIFTILLLAGYVYRRFMKQRPEYETYGKKNYYFVAACLAPWLIILAVFYAYPFVYSIIVSFSKYDFLTSKFNFIGFDNYVKVLKDKEFWKALWHTVFLAIITIPVSTILALFSAVLLNKTISFRKFFQSSIFFPSILSVIVIATIFTYIYAPNSLATFIFDKLGLIRPKGSWLASSAGFAGITIPLLCIALMNIWSSFGYYTILFLAGLQTVPKSLYEASSLEGASSWQQFIKITLPQLKPIIILVVLINTIMSFQIFPEIFTMTKGGPLGNTKTIVYYLYDKGFHNFDMGEASSVAYLLFLLIAAFSLLQVKAMENRFK